MTMRHKFQFGDWLVDPSANSIENAEGKRQMEPRTMDVLVALCEARGAIVSAETLLEQCWGSTLYGDNPVHKNVAQLRRVLGDNASAPVYVETIRKRGYRAMASLNFETPAANDTLNWEHGSPFRGLQAFDEAHADVFFGRDEATAKLVDAAVAQVGSGCALVLVLGPSGSGKTSVVRAGLFPALADERSTRVGKEIALLASTTFDLIDQGEQTLHTALAGALLDLHWQAEWAFPGESAVSLGLRLEQSCDSVIADLHAVLERQTPPRTGLRFGLFIDRFEALFNEQRVAEPQRTAFLKTLEQIARSGAVLLVVGCRNDFYPSIAQYPFLTDGKRNGGHFDLAPPSFSEIAQIIRRPAAAARLSFGVDPVSKAALDDILCQSAASSPDALPLLQYCLEELYRLRTANGELSFEAFHRLGDVEGAIGQRAEQVIVGLTPAQRAALPHIMSLVVVLSTDEEFVTSQRAPWSALRDDEARQAVGALIESRLFVSDLVGGAPGFGIAHDAILRRWPRMTDWIAAHRGALRARGRLAQQVQRWAAEGRPADLLLPQGTLLEEARDLLQAGVLPLKPEESELIQASHRRARQGERRRVFVMSLIVALAILASGLGVSAVAAKRSAELRRSEAENLMDFMLGDFAEKLRPLGRLDLLESVSAKALQYLRGSDGEDMSATALTLRAKGLQVIGEVSRSRGDSRQAIDALRQANAILLRQHLMTPQDIAVLKNLGVNAYWIGQLHKDQNEWDAAGDAWGEYRRFSDLLHQLEPDNAEWWVEQSYAHNNLGSLALTRGRPDLAAPEFLSSIELKRRALAKSPDSHTFAAELADSYSWLASAREALGELDAARQLYEQEMQLVLGLRQRFPAESLWINRQVRALQHRAVISLAMGMDQRALQDYEEARQLFTHIAGQDRSNRAWQVELATLEQDQLRVLARSGDPRAVLPKLTEVHATLATMLEFDPKNAGWTRREAVSRMRMAAGLLAVGRAAEAREHVDLAYAALQRLYVGNPSNQPVRLALIESLLLSANVQRANKDFSNSTMTCKQVYGMIKNDAAVTMNYQILDPWVRVNACLQNQQAAEAAVKRLKQLGYRDYSFVQFVSTL